MSITSFSSALIPASARKAIDRATSNVYAITPVTAPVAFDLKTGEFTGISAYKAMALKELCPSLSLDAEMNRAALWLLCNPTRRPDGALALFTFLVKRLTAAQARHERGAIANASH
jgi:hypothetical protein